MLVESESYAGQIMANDWVVQTIDCDKGMTFYLINLLSCNTGLCPRFAETIVAASGKRTESPA